MKINYSRIKCFCFLLSAHHLSSVSAHAGLFYPTDNGRLIYYGRQLGITLVEDHYIGGIHIGPLSGKPSISESDFGDVVAEGYGWKAYRLDEQYVSAEAITGFLKFLGNLTPEAASALWQEISNKGDIYAVWMDVYHRRGEGPLFRMPYGLIIVDSSQDSPPHVYYHRIPIAWRSLWCEIIQADDRTMFLQEMYNPEEISIMRNDQLLSQWIPDYLSLEEGDTNTTSPASLDKIPPRTSGRYCGQHVFIQDGLFPFHLPIKQ